MNPSTQRTILIGTATLMVLFVLANFFLNHMEPTSKYSLNTSNQPSIGNQNATDEMIVFLDPKCVSCQEFEQSIFPKIKKDYIDTNKIRFVVVPVAINEGSMTATEALLCTYYQDENEPNSDLFFSFLNALYKNPPQEEKDWLSKEVLLKIAEKASPHIQVNKIEKCMDRHLYHTRIMQNRAELLRVTSGKGSVPSLFINGFKKEPFDLDSISKELNKEEKKS